MPSHLYELLPIAVLIGTVFVMARLAQSSEYTILRTSGLGPWRALRMLLGLGLVFVLLTFAIGDYLAPLADRTAQLLKARYQGRITVGQTGAWLKERQPTTPSPSTWARSARGRHAGVRIFEFDARGYAGVASRRHRAPLRRRRCLDAAGRRAHASSRAGHAPPVPASSARRQHRQLPLAHRHQPEMVSVALLKPDRMGTIDLFQYIQHLRPTARPRSATRSSSGARCSIR
jgi:lipopolysaccharide export system permease protein